MAKTEMSKTGKTFKTAHKTAQWLTLGLTAALLSATVGCSPSTPSGNQGSSQQPAIEDPSAAPLDADQANSDQANSDLSNSDLSNSDQANADQPETESANPFRVVENMALESGPDPMALVFAARQPLEEPTGSEQIRLNYPAPDKAVVIVTKTGLADDSVAAIRTRYEFTPADSAAAGAKQWQLVQVTEQNKCQANRGSQDWTGDLCQ